MSARTEYPSQSNASRNASKGCLWLPVISSLTFSVTRNAGWRLDPSALRKQAFRLNSIIDGIYR